MLSRLYPANCVCVCVGYAFLLFQEETSVQALIEACLEEDGKLYLCVSSPTIKDKPVSHSLCRILSNTLSVCLSLSCPYQMDAVRSFWDSTIGSVSLEKHNQVF